MAILRGTGHQRVNASADYLVIGAYPAEGTYDECRSTKDHDHAIHNIAQTVRPISDPAYGPAGPLLTNWL